MSMQSITTWTFDSQEPLTLARRFADVEGTALLYSGGDLDSARNSFLCLFPERKLTVRACEGCWESLKKEIGKTGPSGSSLPRWVGYLGYELGCYADVDKKIAHADAPIPDGCLYSHSVVVHFDHFTQKAVIYSKQGAISLERSPPPSKQNGSFLVSYRSDTLESYIAKIEQAKEWILQGEIYQVNLSQAIHIQGKNDAFELFEHVVRINPAPFSAYLNCGSYAIVSSSPERFLCKKGARLETRPIKGTAPRGKSDNEDVLRKQGLLHSEKERAELLMITDLMRNDLGKISAPGSVRTKALWVCESYRNVFHLLSIIEGITEKREHPVTLLRHLFPGGSITGCPKLRAMEAIWELESRPRGIYTGSIGYFAENGDFDFNIAIRTLVVHAEHIELQLGGAIVLDSDPMKEFEETLHKGRSLFSILDLKEFLL
jgi:para-aminobenzoate synthetase component I